MIDLPIHGKVSISTARKTGISQEQWHRSQFLQENKMCNLQHIFNLEESNDVQ